MKSGRPLITRRGWGLLIAAAAMILVALLFGIEELYPLAVGAVVLVVVAWSWLTLQRWDVRMVRTVHPPRVPAGVEARVELTVRNASGRRSPPVAAGDPFDGGRRWARFAIAPLSPGETRVASYRLPTGRRGIYRLGPLQLEISDPFGLTRRVRTTTPDASLTVHPRIERLSSRSFLADTDHDSRLLHSVLGQGGNEFYGLRQYETGDDLRRVHWSSTARLDELVIRQPENLWRGRSIVAADLRSAVHDDESLERVLSAVASLATSALLAGIGTRVVSTAGLDTRYTSSQGHGPIILDALAAATTHAGDTLLRGLPMLRRGERLIVVTTERCPEDDLVGLLRLCGSNRPTVVIFEREATITPGESALASRGRARMVRVAPRVSLRDAWERA